MHAAIHGGYFRGLCLCEQPNLTITLNLNLTSSLLGRAATRASVELGRAGTGDSEGLNLDEVDEVACCSARAETR